MDSSLILGDVDKSPNLSKHHFPHPHEVLGSVSKYNIVLDSPLQPGLNSGSAAY